MSKFHPLLRIQIFPQADSKLLQTVPFAADPAMATQVHF